MSKREDEARLLTDRLNAVGFSAGEVRSITRTLFERVTHGELAKLEGIEKSSAKKRLYRARVRARKAGIVLPRVNTSYGRKMHVTQLSVFDKK